MAIKEYDIEIYWILFCLFIVENLEQFVNAAEDPDVNRNVPELITSKGYPFETHDVRTPDGYILTMFRIPHGRTNEAKNESVILVHGVLGSAGDFVMNFENSSLGFVLADAGYDVWLANVRGNTYSRKHVQHTTKQKEFWDFSFDEMIDYDAPASIDYILNTTKRKQLHFVGYSQGGIVLFGMLSSKPEYNAKLKIGIALAPAPFCSHTKTPLKEILHKAAEHLGLMRNGEFLSSNGPIKYLIRKICGLEDNFLCQNALFNWAGPSAPEQFNRTRLPVYSTIFPAGTSVKNILHISQIVTTGKFQKYDYGLFGNLEKYKTATPPEYQLANVKIPIALFWGEGDWLVVPTDIAILKSKLTTVVQDFKVPFPQWSHLDFAIGKKGNELYFPQVLALLSDH